MSENVPVNPPAREGDSQNVPPVKLNVKRTLLIGLGFMTTAIAWAFYNFQIPLIIYDFLGVNQYARVPGADLLVGFIMTVDNLIAVPVQPFFGAVSDRLQSRWGRRMPFITIGIIGAAAFFAIAPFMPELLTFMAIIICFNIMMAFYRAPVVALMPDLTPAPVRSKGNALINLMGGIGFILGFVVRLLGTRQVSFILVSVLMIVALVLLLVTIKETPTGEKFFKVGTEVIHIDPASQKVVAPERTEKEAKLTQSRWGDLVDIVREPEKSGLWMLMAIFFVIFGYNSLETFYSKFLTAVFLEGVPLSGLTPAVIETAEKRAAGIMIVLPIMFIIGTIPGGWLGEKYGRRLSIKVGFAFILAAVIVMTFIPTDLAAIPILASIAGFGYGLVNVNTIVVIWQMAPKGRIGAYTGVYYLFSILAAIISPTLMGGIFSILTLAGATEVNTYMAIFPFIIVCVILAFISISRVKRGEVKLTKAEIEALRLKYEEDD